MKKILLSFSAALLTVYGFAQSNDYKVYRTKDKQEITLEEMAQQMPSQSIIIWGEQHDDSIGHTLQARFLELLYAKEKENLTLSMEMFQRDVQYILDEYLQNLISEKNFIKEARAWDNYARDYKPMVEFCKANKLQVIAANSPSRYTNRVTYNGLGYLYNFDKEVRRKYFAPLPVDTLTGAYYEKFLETMGGHSMPNMQLYQSQNFWDATMAWSIHSFKKKNKKHTVFMVNGRFHSDSKLGFVYRLINTYKHNPTTISCFYEEEGAPKLEWAGNQDLADYIIITKATKKKEATP